MLAAVTWHPWITLLERLATDELDRQLAALIAQREEIERMGWFS
jgi:hypothetical protein